MKAKHVGFALLLAFLASAFPALAGVPSMINYQGRLTQPSGAPVADGTYSMLFSIYDAPTGGTALWSETNASVQVKGGLFGAMLGSVVSLPADLFDSPNRYFAVKVSSDPEMTPRQRIASVGYAVKAASADLATTVPDAAITNSKLAGASVTVDKLAAGIATPPGGVIMWSGAVVNIPTGWALCNGQNGTPDLRNRFIVGAGDEYAVAATGGEKLHKLTVAEMPSHTHGFGMGIAATYQVPSGQYHAVFTSGSANTTATGGDGAHENRPPYYALCYIMKLAY